MSLTHAERQKKYTEEHDVKSVTGFRPTQSFSAYTDEMVLREVTPANFFVNEGAGEPFVDAATGIRYHIPRSLVYRVRQKVRGDNGQVISENKIK